MASASALPVLDIAEFLRDPGSSAGRAFVGAVREVTHEIGFFYLTGHGVDLALREDVHRVARQFFALPDELRHEIDNIKSAQFRGYTRFGHEHTNGRIDLRDQIDIGRELPARPAAPGEPAYLRLRGPNLWPSALPELRPVITEWTTRLEPVAAALVHALALALQLPADQFDEVVDPPETLLKVIRYFSPASPASDEEAGSVERRQGVGAHRDTGFVTLLDQDDVGGLQVERDGHLIDVPYRAGSFVVNVGEMLQLVSRGYFRATVHRVISPPPGTERFSIAYFFNPKLEATLAPVDLPAELAAAAPGGESIDATNPILANYGDNSLKVRLRAHPDVARRFHADLLTST